jgi:NAD(P)-dependent dehydrogenase (short-subunit alcohol dehydrogenase family)
MSTGQTAGEVVTGRHGRTVVVTGASTGIGEATVRELDRRGFRVWATVRREADAVRLEQDYEGRVRVLRLDITDDRAVRDAGEVVSAEGPLHGLVNNAGVALPGPLEFLPLDAFRRQLEVNLVGQLAVTQAMLPALRAGSGRVVVVGSIGGRIAGPMIGAYHASKFGLVGLTDTLRAELAPWGLRVVLVEPGAIATSIWERGAASGDEVLAQMPARALELYAAQIRQARQSSARSAGAGLPPAAVAQVIARALTESRPRPRYLVGRDAGIASIVARLPFRLRYRMTAARA